MLPYLETAILLRLARGPMRPSQGYVEPLWRLVGRGFAFAVRGERSVYTITAIGWQRLAAALQELGR
jgi:DNA-binding PadR family transcriptional regulator